MKPARVIVGPADVLCSSLRRLGQSLRPWEACYLIIKERQMACITSFSKPTNATELAHLFGTWFRDQFPDVLTGGGLDEDGGTLEIELDSGDCVVTVESLAAHLSRTASEAEPFRLPDADRRRRVQA